MPKELNLKWAAVDSIFAGIFAFVLGYILFSVIPITQQPVIGVFGIWENLLEFCVLVGAGTLAVALTESRIFAGKDLYTDWQVAIALSILGILGVFTVSFVVAPFNVTPFPLAAGLTVLFEMFVINIFALAFSRAI